jgi:hypothetical protein
MPERLQPIDKGPVRHDDDQSPLSQTKGEEDSMKPNQTTNVSIKPDNFKS